MNDYTPVLILMAVGLAVGVGAILISHLIGPKVKSRMKDTPFECGVPVHGDNKQRISVRFYLVAILFLLFDVEAIFFFPWAVVYKKFLTINGFILFEMLTFMGILFVGYLYVLGKGALEWD